MIRIGNETFNVACDTLTAKVNKWFRFTHQPKLHLRLQGFKNGTFGTVIGSENGKEFLQRYLTK